MSAVLGTKVVTQVQDVHIERMEKALNIWTGDNLQKNMPLSGPLICAKAIHMYAYPVDAGGASKHDAGPSYGGTSGPSPFRASSGWFDCFKKRYSLRNVKLSGECASADHEATETFPAQLAQLIEEKGYLPEQVFNTHETGLF